MNRAFLIPALVLLFAHVGGTHGVAQELDKAGNQKSSRLVFDAKPTKSVFENGEAIELVLTLKNVSTESAIVAKHFTLTQNVSLEIRDAQGGQSKWCGPIVGQVDSRDAFKSLLAGESYSSKLAVSCVNKGDSGEAWGYMIEKPGSYTVVASYFLPQPASFFRKLFPGAQVDRGPIQANLVEIHVK